MNLLEIPRSGKGRARHFADKFRGPGRHFGGHGRRGDASEMQTGDHRGGHRRRRQFDGEALRLLILGLIEQNPRHGYDLIRELAERSGGAYSPSPGMIYPLLTLLGDMALITDTQTEGARKSFTLAPEGAAELVARRAEADALFARLDALATDAARVDPAPVRRAMESLRSALKHRLGQTDADKEIVFAAVALIDETVQKIERL